MSLHASICRGLLLCRPAVSTLLKTQQQAASWLKAAVEIEIRWDAKILCFGSELSSLHKWDPFSSKARALSSPLPSRCCLDRRSPVSSCAGSPAGMGWVSAGPHSSISWTQIKDGTQLLTCPRTDGCSVGKMGDGIFWLEFHLSTVKTTGAVSGSWFQTDKLDFEH